MHLSGLDLLLWALTLFEHCVLFAVLCYYRRANRFPFFTSLIAMGIVRTIVLYFTLHFGSSDSYFYTFWSFGFIDLTLQLAVAYELASHVFRPLGAWAPEVQRTFALLAAVSVLIAALLTWLASPATSSLEMAIVIRGSFFSSALMSELFVAMIALSVSIGLPWRTHVARLAQGFGVYSLFCILIGIAHTYYGTDYGNVSYRTISHLRISLYSLCAAYWIFSMARNEPEPRKLPEQLRLELHALQRQAALLLQGLGGSGRAA